MPSARAHKNAVLVPLDLGALEDLMRSQGLKQSWLAKRVRISDKTLSRWLNGKVRQVDRTSVDRVARALGCPPARLILDKPEDGYATLAETREVSRLLAKEDLLELLGPAHKWALAESLLKAALLPDLPRPALGRLYLQLSISAWRQSRFAPAETYAKKALSLAEDSEHRSLATEAKANLATVAALRGDLRGAIALYEACLASRQLLDSERAVGRVLSNLAITAREIGDLKRAIAVQREAIAVFAKTGTKMNLAIARIGLAQALVERGDLRSAARSLEHAAADAKRGHYARGSADVDLGRADVALAKGDAKTAQSRVTQALARYKELGIDEAAPHLLAARIALRQGDRDAATRALARADAAPAQTVYSQAEALAIRLVLVRSSNSAARSARAKTIEARLRKLCDVMGRRSTTFPT